MSLHTPPPRSVFRELNYTPLERERGERTEFLKKKKKRKERHRDREKQRQTETERKMEFTLLCVASNLEIQFSGTAKSKHQDHQLR